MTEEPLHIDPDKLLEANRDYISRIEKTGVQVVYDAALDTLFIEFGGPKKALSEHLADNIMLRINPKSLEIVGCEILDFFSDFLPNHRLVANWVAELGLEKGKDSSHSLIEGQATSIGELVMSATSALASR